MTREQLLDAVGDIRDAFIREAAPPPASYRKQREFPWTGAVAACLALMIVGSTFFLSQMNMGSGATGSDGASAATEDTAEVSESGGNDLQAKAVAVKPQGRLFVRDGNRRMMNTPGCHKNLLQFSFLLQAGECPPHGSNGHHSMGSRITSGSYQIVRRMGIRYFLRV